jgi:hypothetical protein
MGGIRKKAVLIAATFIVALMFIIPATGRTSNNSSEPASMVSSMIVGTGYSVDRPERRRMIIARRRWWHARRVHRARMWRRHERREHRFRRY